MKTDYSLGQDHGCNYILVFLLNRTQVKRDFLKRFRKFTFGLLNILRMLLVYTHKITPRLNYVFKQIFTRILGLEVRFTTKIEEFLMEEGMKFSYTKQALGNELFVKNNDLLFNQGIDYIDINIVQWEEAPCFFQTNFSSEVPCDIFAASFYLISRYEEYLPHVKDTYERFPASESLAFQNKFLDLPVIDIWAYQFREILLKKFEDEKEAIEVGIRVGFAYSTVGVVSSPLDGFIGFDISCTIVSENVTSTLSIRVPNGNL